MTAADAAETLELSFSFVSVGLRVNVARRAAGAHWTGQRLSVSRDTAALCVGEAGGGQITDSQEELSGLTVYFAPRSKFNHEIKSESKPP